MAKHHFAALIGLVVADFSVELLLAPLEDFRTVAALFGAWTGLALFGAAAL